MEIKVIRQLVDLVEKSGISELEVEDQGFRVRVSKASPVVTHTVATLPAGESFVTAPAAPPGSGRAPGEPSVEAQLLTIDSPMVGTFYRASSPDSPPFVREGDKVTPDTVVCILEAMKVMNELKAGIAGVIQEILVENGQPVEFGQPLYRMAK